MPKIINTNKELILKLRDIRRAKGMSIHEIADKTGIGYQKIGRVERGETEITVDTLYKLSKVLKVPLSKILEEDGLSDLDSDPTKNTNVYIIPNIYNELDNLCSKYNITIENKAKVYIATIIFKTIQDVCADVRNDKDMVANFFYGFDAIFERLVLSQKNHNSSTKKEVLT